MARLVGPPVAAAQPAAAGPAGTAVDTAEVAVDTAEVAVRQAVAAYEAGQPAEAARRLRPLVEAHPAYVSARHGAAARWLGDALAAEGQPEAARRVWRRGLDALGAADPTAPDAPRAFDPVLADRYLQALFEEGLAAERAEAARWYLRLVAHVGHAPTEVGHAPTEEARAVVRRHVAQLAPLLPDALRQALGFDEHMALGADVVWRARLGTRLAAWWRQQDPVPATDENERVEEHLTRVAAAQAAYAPKRPDPGAWPAGYDDRGRIYVRYGPPFKERSISFTDGFFLREVVRFGVPVVSSDFPDNELWAYPAIDRAAYFVFVERGGAFREATVLDLLPRALRRPPAPTKRGQNIGYSSVAALRYITRELALFNPDFGALYDDIENYAMQQENLAASVNANGGAADRVQTLTVGGGLSGTRTVVADPQFGLDPPSRYAASSLSRTSRLERRAARRRARAVPRQRSNLGAGLASLPVIARTARFLEPDGRTRAEVYWTLTDDALRGPTDAAADRAREGATYAGRFLRVTATQYPTGTPSAPGARRATYRRAQPYVFPAPFPRPLAVLPQTLTLPGDTTTFDAAVQWDAYAAEVAPAAKGGLRRLSAQLARGVERIDSLRALRATPGRVEMSDLKPLTLPEGADLARLDAAAVPYPFGNIGTDTPLLLYFEVYHLLFGDGDRTRYTVEYEVRQQKRRSALGRLFSGEEEQTVSATSTAATYEGTSSRTSEYISLDLAALEAQADGSEVEVVVRVTDETNGTTVARTLAFDLRPAD